MLGILVTESVNVIKLVILVNIQIIKIVNAKNKIVDKLVDQCTETVEEVKLANTIFAENENGNSYKCIPCSLYVLLFLIFFTINVGGIVTYYVYSQWYFKKRFTIC